MMPPVTLEGDTLGKKHQHYNKLVEDAVANKHYKLCNISDDDSDIDNLLKINIASKNRNVDYIIEVLKSNDMLYAATAIKKSTWLITEQQYANIINPEYLHTELLPNMNTKIFNKFMLHIRLNLKDESRVEIFYKYLKETDGAYKWLLNCSIPFIENVIKNERRIPIPVFQSLCRRSVYFLAYHKRVEEPKNYEYYELINEILFLLKSHTEEVLNFLEDGPRFYFNNKIGKKQTEILMKKCPHRIFDKFEIYADYIDLPIAAKYLKKEEIKPFLFKQIKTQSEHFCDFDKLKHFVKNMPKEEKLEFIKQTFIDRTDLTFLRSEDEKHVLHCSKEFYHWYEYVPFNVAMPEIKKLILAENSTSERFNMLSVLITCARRNPQHIKMLLNFFYERHINEPFKFKMQFVYNLLSQISIHKLDVETWNILDQLFHSMEVYTESENNVQICHESIILYNVLHDEPVPEIVEQKIIFETFENIQRRLNQDQNNKIFTYLLNSVLTKIQCKNIANESDFNETLLQLKNALTLLKDWKKDITCYPFVLEKIQKLVRMKQENMWKIDMSCLYNIKKSWRKHMFEESLSLCLCEETCLNALKHKPQLLTRHDKELDTLRTNEAVSLRRLLAKLRVYWPHSLAQHWTKAYLQNLNKPTGQKAVLKGLFALLPQNQIIDMAKQHAPKDFKINWGETDQAKIIIRKNIAKHLHVVRPLIPLDTVLWYAKGDYLQYAVPSLHSILTNLSELESRKHVLKLLESPSSLQKLGLHIAFSKLKLDELKSLILNIWNTTTNSLIRFVIFRNTYRQICRAKNKAVEKEQWTLLSMFIDKLTLRENRKIYECLGEVGNVPISVRAEFYMKSYEFLTSLAANANAKWHNVCVWLVSNLVSYASDNSNKYDVSTLNFVELLDDDFVIDKLLSPVETKFCLRDSNFINIFACYVLWSKTEEDQLQRFRRVIDPTIEEAFLSWSKSDIHEYYVKNNFKEFIHYLNCNYKDFTLSRRTTPAKLFTEIKIKIEKNMHLLDNYVLYTSWKLITEYAKLMDQHISEIGNAWLTDEKEKIWDEIHVAMFPDLSSIIFKCLKEDTEQYFPSICLLFTDALNEMFHFISFNKNTDEFKLNILKFMLSDPDFIPSYVVVSRATMKHTLPDSLKNIRTEICKKIKSHPSREVQMHYYNDFKGLLIDLEG